MDRSFISSTRSVFVNCRRLYAVFNLLVVAASPGVGQCSQALGHMDVVPGPVNIYYHPRVKEQRGTNSAVSGIRASAQIEPCPGGAVGAFALHEVRWPEKSDTPIAIRSPEGK